MTDALDRADVQAIILTHYRGYRESRHHLFRLDAKPSAQRFIARLLPSVTHGLVDRDAASKSLLNIGLAWRGLVVLGAFDGVGGEANAHVHFSAFNEPPNQEALKLADRNAPSRWWNGRFATADIGASVHVYARSTQELDEASAAVRAIAAECGIEELRPTRDADAITGSALSPTGRQLHFGYQDGIAHPSVNWDDDPRHGGLARRHFLLGEPDDGSGSQPRGDVFPFIRRGAFMAFAWTHQDVAQFNRFLRDEAPKVAPEGLSPDEGQEWLAAKLMGRWRDGTPLALSPDRPDAALATRNDFLYASDPAGLRCPLAAHIRIVNGRDQPLNKRNADMFPEGFPQVLRRGMPYGRVLDGFEDDGEDRGVIGMFVCANLNRQFYSLTRWIGQTNFSDVYKDKRGQDPLVGDRGLAMASHRFEIPTEQGPKVVKTLPDFVRMQGLAFLLLPSLTGLRLLAGGAAVAAD